METKIKVKKNRFAESLGDWCKWLEKNFSPEQMIPSLPVIIRLDGNNFHNWTKGLQRPFDKDLTNLMIDTTKYLVEKTNAAWGYTQSDEITLVLYTGDRDTPIYHNGKKQKILSKLTAECVNYFNSKRPEYLPDHNKIAIFDCRIYQAPTAMDAIAQVIWRENDAVKNSISMLAQSQFSHSALQNLNGHEMKELLLTEKGIDWENLPDKYRKGTHIKKVKVAKTLDPDELNELPENHHARKNPDMVIERNVISLMEIPLITTIVNKEGVFFKNEEPTSNELWIDEQ